MSLYEVRYDITKMSDGSSIYYMEEMCSIDEIQFHFIPYDKTLLS